MAEMNIPTLYTIKEAAARIRVAPGSLRTEIKRGTLAATRIGGRVYITEEALREMLDACRDNQKEQGCISDQAGMPDGSSETAQRSAAQAAALMTAQVLRERYKTTSPASTRRQREKAS